MSDSQYIQYENLHIYATEWRKFKPEKGFKLLSREQFKKDIQFDGYILLEYRNNENLPVLIYLLMRGSRIATASQDMRKLLNKIKERCEVYLVIDVPLTVYIQKTIASFRNLKIKCLRQEHFSLIVPNHVLAGKHRIMTYEESDKLLNQQLFTTLANLPKIYEDDPQCIWIGAKVGDLIEINNNSIICNESISYRVVIPRAGRIILSKQIKNEKEKNDSDAEVDADADAEIDADADAVDDDEIDETDVDIEADAEAETEAGDDADE